MKKLFLVFISMFILTFGSFAATYKILGITGKVFVNDTQVIAPGQVLNEEDVLNVRPQASITLQPIDGIEKRTFKGPNNKITVKDAWIQSAVGRAGLKKGTIIKASNIAPPSEGTRKGVATAASRASEAKEDFDWDE